MLALINARLIDGTGRPPLKNAAVLVEGARIKYAGAAVSVPEGATAVDLKGRTLLPAFSEAHTHFGGSEFLTRPALGGRELTYDYALNSAAYLRWGVTTVRSAGDWMPDIVSFRDDVEREGLPAPRILTAGRMFVAPGGHPLDTVYQSNPAIRDNACVVCDDDTDIDGAVKALAELGVDWIKAFLSTMNKLAYPEQVPRLSHTVLKRITEAAHKYGKPVMLHVENPADIDEALTVGVQSIEHVIGVGNTLCAVDDSLLKRLADSGTFVVPTLSAIKAHDDSLKGAAPVYARLEAAVGRMIAAGVKIGVGCDSGIPFHPYGECLHTELELLVQAGMAPLEALAAATAGNARLFGLEDRLGTVESGKIADLVVLDADPLADIRNTRRLRLVMKAGRVMADMLLSE